MNPVRRNLLANFIGRGWTALMALAFVPVYIRYLGIEAYGLVGFYASLQAISLVLDLGLSTAINRGLATLAAKSDGAAEQRDLVRTLELVNWGLAALIGVVVVALAPIISTHWINAHGLSADTICHAVQVMGVTLALRWPCNLYAGALGGLQRQISVNVISGIGATVGNLGVIAVLEWCSPTIGAFFAWQLLASAGQTLATGWWIWRCLPPAHRPARFNSDVLASHWRFAAGMSALTILALLLTQSDKIILSKLLSLEEFGYYSLASVAANGLLMLVNPLFTATFPAFSTAVAQHDHDGLRHSYHRASRLAACLILPPALTIAALPGAFLLAWSGDPALAAAAGPALGLLALGSALNGLMNIPYALQLANGSTRLACQCNAVAVLVLVPLVTIGALTYGVAGAAAGWPLLNLAYVVFATPLIHRRFMPGAHRRWLLQDTAIPLALAAASAAGLFALSASTSRTTAAMTIATALMLSYGITWLGCRASWAGLSRR